MMAMRRLDHDAAAGDAPIEMLELVGALADTLADEGRRQHFAESDLQRNGHGSLSS